MKKNPYASWHNRAWMGWRYSRKRQARMRRASFAMMGVAVLFAVVVAAAQGGEQAAVVVRQGAEVPQEYSHVLGVLLCLFILAAVTLMFSMAYTLYKEGKGKRF